MFRQHRHVLAMMSRQRSVLLAVCIISLATIWSCRRPRPCILDQCNADITAGPVAHRKIDLSDSDAPFVGWPLARVCSETSWTDGLVFICDDNSGGIGNIRNYILTCVRYAIEAGATGLVMPQVRARSENNLTDIMQEHRGMSYMFDEDHFRTSLTSQCPRIVIYNNTWSIPDFKEPYRPERITPKELGLRGGCDKRDLNRHTDLFRIVFREWLLEKTEQFNLPPTSTSHPRVVRLNWGVQLEFPVYRDGPEFVATYGGLLRFRQDILQLGKRTVEAMRDFARTASGDRAIDRFVGFHLRTESDALAAWPKFDNQSAVYLREATARGFTTAYLATGNGTEAAKLVETARSKHDIVVTTKHELLKGNPADVKALEALTWDQQALIDFIVLLACDFFLGVNPSSFSMNVALKRHLQMEGLYTRPWKVGRDDGRSLIVGRFERYWDDWLFMYDSIWP